MSKSTALKVASQFLSLLLCLILLPAAFAQPEDLNGTVTYENGTYESDIVPGLEEIYGNYTVHDIKPTYYSVYLMPGENKTFNVSFKNEGNETLDIAPKVIATPDYYYEVNESWVTIFPENVTVSPGVKQNFAIDVSIPEDTESGEYEAQIAFTNDTYPEEYDDPIYIQESTEEYSDSLYVNAMYLWVSVPVRPKLELQTSYISDTIEPGKEYVYSIQIKNVAGKDVTIDPKIMNYEIYDYSFEEPAFSSDIIEISAPSIIKADEIANMTIRVPVPENASGSYGAFIEMNADGNENDGSVPQIGLSFMVDKQPTVPYVKTFNSTTDDPITIEVSAETYDQNALVRISPQKEETYFEMNLTCNSNPVNLTLVKATESGTIYSQGYALPIWAIKEDSNYQSDSSKYIERYRVPGTIGTWELTILPKNTNSFDYSITVGEFE